MKKTVHIIRSKKSVNTLRLRAASDNKYARGSNA